MVDTDISTGEALPKEALSIRRRATLILQNNDMGGYTVPTEGMYPYQWNWDSAFVALGFAVFAPARALDELEALFDGQWATGMVPHIIFRKDDPRYFPGPSVWRTGRSPESSGITQPPVAASVVLTLWRQLTDPALRERLARLFPKILGSHRWFHDKRDPDRRGIVVMTHPWESGRDNSPEWDAPGANVDTTNVEPYQRRDLDHADAAMRPTQEEYDRYITLLQYGREHDWDYSVIAREGPFRVADVGLSFILHRADQDLLALAREIGGEAQASVEEINDWIARGASGAALLWDDERKAFCSRDLITGRSSGFVTSASFLCFYAGLGDDKQRAAMLRHFDRVAACVSFMTPSFDPDDPQFDPDRYWRGPCWAVINYMIAKGLAEAGHSARASRVERDTKALVETTGFQEAFNPISGKGSGGTNFSWTAAMWLAWLDEQETDSGAEDR